MHSGAKFFVGFLTILVISAGGIRPSMAKCPVRMGSLYPPDRFSVISDRGSIKKFPENTLPALQDALNVGGANALMVDLSLTLDKKVILWRDGDSDHPSAGQNPWRLENFKSSRTNDSKSGKKSSELTLTEFTDRYGYENKITPAQSRVKIPTLKDFMDWATQQGQLKLVLFKLAMPEEESHLAPVLLEEIMRVVGTYSPAPHFEFVFLTPHKEILNMAGNSFKEFKFSYDREISSVKIINYHAHTTVPIAMEFKNRFSSIGLKDNLSMPSGPDPWDIYKFILTLDFKLRDNYKESTANYIKIISWTFNDEKKIRCLINLGVDGIVTNHPERVRKIALDMGKILD